MSEENEKIRVLVVEPFERPYVKMIGSSLEELQSWVGGYIEAIYPFEDPVALICNEEGKMEDLPLNRGLYTEEGDLYDIISGRFLVTGITEDSFGSLSDELTRKYEKLYHDPEVFIRIDKHLQAFNLYEARKARELAIQAMYLCEFSGYTTEEKKALGKEVHEPANREIRYMESLLKGEDLELYHDLKEIEKRYPNHAGETSHLLQKIEEFYGRRNMERLEIYQMAEDDRGLAAHRFEPYDWNLEHGFTFGEKNYTCVYRGPLSEDESLEDIYVRFNLNHPKSFSGHSLSVSDVVVVRKDGKEKTYYVDSIGFKELDGFRKVQEKAHVKNKESVLER